MSDPLRIAIVVEGPTDRIVIEAALKSILGDRPFVLTQLQPEGSLVFGARRCGWAGVYRWCKQSAARRAGTVSGDALLFQNYDVLLLHLDAEVAEECYANGPITPSISDLPLPCDQPCPPPAATVDALRFVLMSWCGEPAVPPRIVACIPSRSTEAWVMAALFPHDRAVRDGIECLARPAVRLALQPKARRIKKRQRDYQARADTFQSEWGRVIAAGRGLAEARRFHNDLVAVLAAV
jgi:hypothetical protein